MAKKKPMPKGMKDKAPMPGKMMGMGDDKGAPAKKAAKPARKGAKAKRGSAEKRLKDVKF